MAACFPGLDGTCRDLNYYHFGLQDEASYSSSSPGSRLGQSLDLCRSPRPPDPVWKQAATELSEAEYIFVCGYSLPDTDQFFKYLFALGTMGQRPLMEFLVVDPDVALLADRYQALLGKGSERRFFTLADGFYSFSRQIENKFQYDAPRPEW